MHPHIPVHVRVVDQRFKRYIWPYMFQSAAAALALFLVLALQDLGTHAVIVAAIASTTFILFFMPRRNAARPRKVLGGHFWGVLIGGAIALFAGSPTGLEFAGFTGYAFEIEAALAVGLTMLAMVATSTEHAPAPGTALGLVINPFDWRLVLFVVISVVLLSLAHRLMRPWLRDLV